MPASRGAALHSRNRTAVIALGSAESGPLCHEGRFYLPDAEERKREALVTTVIDAKPIQCLLLPVRVSSRLRPTHAGWLFHPRYFHFWNLACCSAPRLPVRNLVLAMGGTAVVPEKAEKDVGLDEAAPLHLSGPTRSAGGRCTSHARDHDGLVSLVSPTFFTGRSRRFPPATAISRHFLAMRGGSAAAWFVDAHATRVAVEPRGSRWRILLRDRVAIGPPRRRRGDSRGAVVHRALNPKTMSIRRSFGCSHLVRLPAAVGALMQIYCLARRLAGRMTGATTSTSPTSRSSGTSVAVTIASPSP